MEKSNHTHPHSGKSREELILELASLKARLASEQNRHRRLAQECYHLKANVSGGNRKRLLSRKSRKAGCKSGMIDENRLVHDIQGFLSSFSRLEKFREKLENRLIEQAMTAEARLRHMNLKLAQIEEQERGRIADMLHDDLQQLLVGARFQFQAFARNHPSSPVLENIARLLDRSVDTARDLFRQLHAIEAHSTDSASPPTEVTRDHGEQLLQAEEMNGEESKKIRILFVDDHKVTRRGLMSIVAGYPWIEVVGEAENGREALEVARRLRPDVVVMDLNMPEMDGLKATGRLKAELPYVRVIGLSMYDEEEIAIAKAMRLAGAEAYVNKSASPDELLKVIAAVARKIR